MSKRNDSLVGLLAFVGLILVTLFNLLSLLDARFDALYTLSYVCLLIVVFYSAWEFAKRQALVWRFVYFVIVFLAILGFILGNFNIV